MWRREYNIWIRINGFEITKIIIDPHYEKKHSGSLSDQIILRLVRQLDGQYFEPEDIEGSYLYFVTDGLVLDGKRYKLIWLLENHSNYIGIVNAYRRSSHGFSK